MPKKKIKGAYKRFEHAIALTMHMKLITVFKNKRRMTEFTMALIKFMDPTLIEEESTFTIFSEREAWKRKIILGFFEIGRSFQALRDISQYIKFFPQKLDSKSRYLGYHISNYYNEIYIFTERLKRYKKIIGRTYKLSPKTDQDTHPLTRLDNISNVFNGMINLRGRHVHVNRFSDYELTKISLFESSESFAEPTVINPETKSVYKNEINKERKKWVKLLEETNVNIESLLDSYFYILLEIVFDRRNKMKAPNRRA